MTLTEIKEQVELAQKGLDDIRDRLRLGPYEVLSQTTLLSALETCNRNMLNIINYLGVEPKIQIKDLQGQVVARL